MTKKLRKLVLRAEAVRHLTTSELVHVHAGGVAVPRPMATDTKDADHCVTLLVRVPTN